MQIHCTGSGYLCHENRKIKQSPFFGILDAFRKMDESLGKEKEAALKKFAEREAHIFQAKQSMLNFWGRVEGIATDSLNRVMKMLEESEQKQIE